MDNAKKLLITLIALQLPCKENYLNFLTFI
jgi:hypothetical protein